MTNEKKILILASGGGSNAEAIVKYAQKRNLPIGFIVGCDKKQEKAGVYEKMEKLGVVVHYLPAPYGDHSQLSEFLKANKFDLIVLAGYMRILPPEIADNYDIVNIHPSILPFVYKGSMDAYQDALNNCDVFTGCTVHKVTSEVDAGERLGQIAFEIPVTGGIDKLKAKGLAHEHALYPEVISSIVFGTELNLAYVAGVAQDNLAERGLGITSTIVPEYRNKVFAEFDPKKFLADKYSRFEK